MPTARRALISDFGGLLSLFAVSEVSPHAKPEEAKRIWAETLARRGLTVFVSCTNDRIVATCMLFTAPNLLRGGEQHGFLENVVTHPDFRGQGHGRAVVRA